MNRLMPFAVMILVGFAVGELWSINMTLGSIEGRMQAQQELYSSSVPRERASTHEQWDPLRQADDLDTTPQK